MALSKEDKQRIVELSGKGRKKRRTGGQRPRPDDTDLNLAGHAATPLMAGTVPRGAHGGTVGLWIPRLRRWAMFALPPAAVVLALGAYSFRHDLHKMDVGAVFDSSRGLTLRHRFMDQVRLQKQKRALLDEGYALSFANQHMAAVAKADHVLALEAGNPEATMLRATALDRQVVYASGALQAGDVEEAIARVQTALAQERVHPAGQQLLWDCAQELTRRARHAFERGDYGQAGTYVHRAETIVPDDPEALALHGELVQLHVRRADKYYLEGDYLRALEHIEHVRVLEDDNTRTAGLFKKIDEKVALPEITINSVLTVAGESRVMATINGRTVQLKPGDTFWNVRLLKADHHSGEVLFEQIYTGQQLPLVRTRGGGGHTFITPSGQG